MNLKAVAVALGLGALASGCVSYTGVTGPGDDLVDEANQPYAAKAAKEYDERQKFSRPVLIQEAEGVNLFLSPNWVPRSNNERANALCSNLEVRRSMLQGAKAQLRDVVMTLKDLKLVGDAQKNIVEITTDMTPSNVYRITYNISNVDMQLHESESISLKRGMSSHENKICYEWIANVSVEVRMIKPDGSTAFNFTAVGTHSQMDDGSLEPNQTMLVQATTLAIKTAMKKYAFEFGPPIYVTDTCQDGEFARLSVGTAYGLQKNMRVEFFRMRETKNVNGEVSMVKQRVGLGVIGAGDAPCDKDSVWAHVESYDKENRTVFQWTSARLLEGEGSVWPSIPGF